MTLADSTTLADPSRNRSRLDRIEAKVAYLASSAAAFAKGTIDGTKGLTITDGASHVIGRLGNLGSSQIGLRIFNANGHILLEAFSAFFSRVALYDNAQRELLSDDPFAGGLSRPRVPVCIWDSASQAAATTSASYVTQEIGFGYQQAAAVRIELVVSSSLAGTTGLARVLDPAGVQIGSPVVISAGVTQRVTIQAALPSWPSSAGAAGDFTIQALRNAGTGTVSARGVGAAWGAASYDTN
ncbi:MAG: hypothetical protein JWO46_1798 [Nocardioidaceae bacterium]|nr:hypothetical protein [Nocardioidaceae bacterium]